MVVVVRWATVQQVVSCGYSAEEIFGGVMPGSLSCWCYLLIAVPMYPCTSAAPHFKC